MADRLGEIDRLKDEFFTGISHDLRTPLAAIRWSADLLQTGSLGPLTPKQARLAETIQSSSRRLLALVGQIVELGRFRAGRLQLDLRPTDLRDVIGQAVEEVRPLAERGQLRLEVSIPDDSAADRRPMPSGSTRSSSTCSRTRCASRRRAGASPSAPRSKGPRWPCA